MKAPRQAIPTERRLASTVVLAFAVLGALCAGCAAKSPTLAPSAFGARPDGSLEIVLGFDGAADLDLYVSDPKLETVYFGNSPSTNGARLDRDVRCELEAEGDARRETVRFDAPRKGRYRVGVDYVKACRRFRRQASYTLHVVAPGFELEQEGRIEPGRFDHKALEFDWPPAPTATAPID